MPASRGKGDRGLATGLHSRLVRCRAGRCQACGAQPPWEQLDAAHIIGRTAAWTRTWSPNLLALCRGCHRRFDQDKTETVRVLTGLCERQGWDLDSFMMTLTRRRNMSSSGQRIDWEDERLTIEVEAMEYSVEFARDEMTRGSFRTGSVPVIEAMTRTEIEERLGRRTLVRLERSMHGGRF